MSDSTHLKLPLIAASQSQKHVTINEALVLLDSVVQLTVKDRDLAAPPGSPVEGDRYLVASGGTGAWATWDLNVALYTDGAWRKIVPAAGWIVWIIDEASLVVFNGSAWVDPLSMVSSLQNMALLGVGTTADATNPLSAKLNNALWVAKTVAEGGNGDLRYKLSKEGIGNTLSFLFQNNYSGRAELGLTGDDIFRIKTSANGNDWRIGLEVDGNGFCVFPYGFKSWGWMSAPQVNASGPVGTYRGYGLTSNGVFRFDMGITNQAETGGNVGSNYYLNRFDDLGSFLGTVLFIDRASGEIVIGGNIRPGVSNAFSLGTSVYRWNTVYLQNSPNVISDVREKDVAGRIDTAWATAIVRAIDPVLYTKKVDHFEVYPRTIEDDAGEKSYAVETAPVPGECLHAGFLSGEVRAAVEAGAIDVSVWGCEDKDDPESIQWLVPDELVPLIWSTLRGALDEIASLKEEIRELRGLQGKQ